MNGGRNRYQKRMMYKGGNGFDAETQAILNLDRRNNFNDGRGFLNRADVNANLLNAGVNA